MKKLIVLVVLLMVLLTACGVDEVRINMSGTNWGNDIDFRYQTFTGYEVNRLDAESGEVILLDYDMVVEKGSLHIQVMDPDGDVLWEDAISSDLHDQIEIDVEQSGEYVLRIDADDAGGSMETHWEVE